METISKKNSVEKISAREKIANLVDRVQNFAEKFYAENSKNVNLSIYTTLLTVSFFAFLQQINFSGAEKAVIAFFATQVLTNNFVKNKFDEN